MRLIDADTLKIRAEYGYNDNGLLFVPLRDVKRSIDNAPTVDAVDVVRCGECKYRNTEHFWLMCAGRQEDFFCAQGERRGNNAVD